MRDSYNLLHLRLTSPGDALHVADTRYPGWLAFVSGRPASLSSPAEVFRSVEVPAGEHEVLFAFYPLPVLAGLFAALLALAALAGWITYHWRKHERPS
jgi:hypothetical protein